MSSRKFSNALVNLNSTMLFPMSAIRVVLGTEEGSGGTFMAFKAFMAFVAFMGFTSALAFVLGIVLAVEPGQRVQRLHVDGLSQNDYGWRLLLQSSSSLTLSGSAADDGYCCYCCC